MRGRACWGGAVLVVLLRCASSQEWRKEPAPGNYLAGCHISCPGGFMFRPQHLCRGPRWFEDVLLKDHVTTRGADGGILSDVYVTNRGDFARQDVELGMCSTVITGIIARRGAEERGVHPGEDDHGRSTSSQ